MDFVASLGGGAKMLLRHVRVYRVRLRVVVAEDDAAQTAITFGHMNALIYTAYTAARGLFNLKKAGYPHHAEFYGAGGFLAV